MTIGNIIQVYLMLHHYSPNQIAYAAVDCTVQTSLCSKFDVTGYEFLFNSVNIII